MSVPVIRFTIIVVRRRILVPSIDRRLNRSRRIVYRSSVFLLFIPNRTVKSILRIEASYAIIIPCFLIGPDLHLPNQFLPRLIDIDYFQRTHIISIFMRCFKAIDNTGLISEKELSISGIACSSEFRWIIGIKVVLNELFGFTSDWTAIKLTIFLDFLSIDWVLLSILMLTCFLQTFPFYFFILQSLLFWNTYSSHFITVIIITKSILIAFQ